MQFDIHMPEVAPEIAELRLERWTVALGDEIAPGTTLCELSAVSRTRISRLQVSRTPFLARFRSGVEQIPIIGDGAPTVVLIAAEQGVVSGFDASPETIVRTGDRLARVDIGDVPGDGGRFSTLAEIRSSDAECDS